MYVQGMSKVMGKQNVVLFIYLPKNHQLWVKRIHDSVWVERREKSEERRDEREEMREKRREESGGKKTRD